MCTLLCTLTCAVLERTAVLQILCIGTLPLYPGLTKTLLVPESAPDVMLRGYARSSSRRWLRKQWAVASKTRVALQVVISSTLRR